MKVLLTLSAFSLVAFTANAQSTLKGDVNGDGDVNVTDVTLMVAHILGQQSNDFIAANADVNNDGDITVTDVTETVAIILNGSGSDATSQAYLTCPDDNHPHMIDLGLPSDTKWACCNVGASVPEAYGGYYAWGETEEKDIYNWSTYIHCSGTYNSSYYIGDDISGTQYDVAHEKWGDGWVMPSLDLIKELLDNCTSEWTTFNGVNGRKFTSKNNGGNIFLPAAGEHWTNLLLEVGSGGTYWSSSQYLECVTGAYSLNFYSAKAYWGCDDNKYEGRSVRPITNMTTIPPLYLSTSTLTLYTGNEDSVKIVSGSGNYTVQCNDESIATATIQGGTVHVTAIRSGNATVTVTDTKSGLSAGLNVFVDPSYLTCPDDKHPHIIDLGLPSGTKWACCNVGATTPEDFGGYYAWGETEEKTNYNNVTYLYSTGTDLDGDGWYDDYDVDTDDFGVSQNLGNDIAGTQYDVAYMTMGDNWMMPSIDRFKELLDNCTHEWSTQNGIYGRRFTSNVNGGNIFFPAAGVYFGEDLVSANIGGYYWSSSQDLSFPGYAFIMVTDSYRARCDYSDNRYIGKSVRSVWVP